MHIVVKELDITSDDIENHNDRDELKLLKIKLDSITSKIDYKLDVYKIRYVEKGISGDYEWYKRAKSKKRLYGLMSQLIQTRIAILKKEQHEAQRNSFNAILMRKLRERLGEEALNEIIDEVHIIHNTLCTT